MSDIVGNGTMGGWYLGSNYMSGSPKFPKKFIGLLIWNKVKNRTTSLFSKVINKPTPEITRDINKAITIEAYPNKPQTTLTTVKNKNTDIWEQVPNRDE